MFKKSLKNPYILLGAYTLLICVFYLGKGHIFPELVRFYLQTFTFYLLIGSINKKCLDISLVVTLIVGIVVHITQVVYGQIDFNFFCSMYYTDLDESLSYIKVFPFWLIFSITSLIFITIFLVKSLRTKINLNNKIKLILFIFLISFPLKKVLLPNPNKKPYLKDYFYIMPIRKIVLFHLYFEVNKQFKMLNANLNKKDTWKLVNPQTPKKRSVVIVLGESVRKDFLHSYGFPIKNTPFIESSKHIQFNNFVSVASNTLNSLLRTLTISKDLKTYDSKNSIITLANKVGYKTYWISNQGKVGKWDTPISMIAKKADSVIFLKQGAYDFDNSNDFELLPHFNKIIKKEEPKLIVLHMLGSHPSSCDRTNNTYDEFIKSKDISCYNKSIKNLDLFLGKVYKETKENNTIFDIVYFSDHGLAIKRGSKMIHSNHNKAVHDVPLLLWNNRLKESKKINSFRSGKDFLYLINELLEIKTKNLNSNYQFISEEASDEEIRIYDFKKIIPYRDLEDTDIKNITRDIKTRTWK